MGVYSYLVVQVAIQMPVLLIVAAGLVLVSLRRRVLRRSAMPAIAGCAVLFASTVISLVWQLGFPLLIREDVVTIRNISAVAATFGLLSTVTLAAGLGLLITAVLLGAQRTDAGPAGYGSVTDGPPGPSSMATQSPLGRVTS